MNGNHNDGPVDLVPPENACPNCGEREPDELVWLDDERVECQQCHTIYRPGVKDESSS